MDKKTRTKLVSLLLSLNCVPPFYLCQYLSWLCALTKDDYSQVISLFGLLSLAHTTPRLITVLQIILAMLVISDLVFLLSVSGVWVVLPPHKYYISSQKNGKIVKNQKETHYDSWNRLHGLHTIAQLFTAVIMINNCVVIYLLAGLEHTPPDYQHHNDEHGIEYMEQAVDNKLNNAVSQAKTEVIKKVLTGGLTKGWL